MHGKMRTLGAATLVLASAVLGLVTSAQATVERIRASTASATVLATLQDGCVTWNTQVSAYGTTSRVRSTTLPDSAVLVWVSAYDTCAQAAVGSWQGDVRPAADALSLADDLSTARIRAQVPVSEWVNGGSSVVEVDLELRNNGVALDQIGASHYHDAATVVNWSGTFTIYDASIAGSVTLEGRELVAGHGLRSAMLTADSFGQTLVTRQQLMARAFAGAAGGGPAGSSSDGVTARWSDSAGCRFAETTVAAADATSWDGTRQVYASIVRLEYDACTGGDVNGFYATAELALGALTTHATTNASVAATLTGSRLDTGAPVRVDLDLGWRGTGARGTWQLTLHYAAPSNSTFHHNEAWRPASISGTIALDGQPFDPGTFAEARFHSETNVVTAS